MKNWTWKQWTAFGIIAALVIALVVCHLVQPVVTYAWLEIVSSGTFIFGAVAGYLFSKKDIIQINS